MNLDPRRAARLILIYGTVLVVSAMGPLWLKQLATGTVGPGTVFIAVILISPLAFLGLGLLFGKRIAFAHLALLLSVAVLEWVRYPSAPPMNFMRQIALGPGGTERLALLYTMGFLANLLRGATCERFSSLRSNV